MKIPWNILHDISLSFDIKPDKAQSRSIYNFLHKPATLTWSFLLDSKGLSLVVELIWIISRPGQSNLRQQLINSFIHGFSHPFPPTALQSAHAQKVRDDSAGYKIDYINLEKSSLNCEWHQHCNTGLTFIPSPSPYY